VCRGRGRFVWRRQGLYHQRLLWLLVMLRLLVVILVSLFARVVNKLGVLC
jgi:hypothetical protein